jgi:hypothetical protein
MAKGWEGFVHTCVLPFLHARTLPVLSPEAVRREFSKIVDHQHGYWQGGARSALLCRRAGVTQEALREEIKALGEEITRRHASVSAS